MERICYIYLKLDKSKMNKEKRQFMKGIFDDYLKLWNSAVETKEIQIALSLYYDYCYYLWKIGKVEKQPYPYITTSILLALSNKIAYYVKTRKRRKRGKLKKKDRYETISIPSCTGYKIKGNEIKFTGCKYWFKFEGEEQLKNIIKYRGASITRIGNSYCVKIKVVKEYNKVETNGLEIAFDFGIKNDLTDNYGNTYNWEYPLETNIETLIEQQKKFYIKHGIYSNKKNKKIRIALLNRDFKKKQGKDDFIKSIKKYKMIVIQNESLKEWKKHLKLYSIKKMNDSILGMLKYSIINLPQTVVVDKYYKSTQICPVCGKINKLTLNDRTYKCNCGYCEDRDKKAAICILQKAKENII